MLHHLLLIPGQIDLIPFSSINQTFGSKGPSLFWRPRFVPFGTQRKEKEKQLLQLNRVLRALSDSNQALLRATDEPVKRRQG